MIIDAHIQLNSRMHDLCDVDCWHHQFPLRRGKKKFASPKTRKAT